MRYLLVAALLCGCEAHIALDHDGYTVTNDGPHAIVFSNEEMCLLLRPGESGVWSGPAEISTPDGYEVASDTLAARFADIDVVQFVVDSLACERYRRYTGEDQ